MKQVWWKRYKVINVSVCYFIYFQVFHISPTNKASYKPALLSFAHKGRDMPRITPYLGQGKPLITCSLEENELTDKFYNIGNFFCHNQSRKICSGGILRLYTGIYYFEYVNSATLLHVLSDTLFAALVTFSQK